MIVMQRILTAVEAEVGDLVCIIADPKPSVVANVLGRLRLEIGRRKGLRDPNVLQFALITDLSSHLGIEIRVVKNHCKHSARSSLICWSSSGYLSCCGTSPRSG